MRDDAELMDEIVADAYRQRRDETWRDIGPLNKAILDTDTFSEISKGVNPTVAANARAYRQAFARYTISAVTFMEIVRGYQKKQASAAIASLPRRDRLRRSDPVRPARRRAGRPDRRRTGADRPPIGLADPMIAAIALTHGLELVTGNTAHFQRIQQLGYPLMLANWR